MSSIDKDHRLLKNLWKEKFLKPSEEKGESGDEDVSNLTKEQIAAMGKDVLKRKDYELDNEPPEAF